MIAMVRDRDTLADLADNVRELTQYYRHQEPRPNVWSEQGNKRHFPPWVSWHAPLLTQLHQAVYEGRSGEIIGGRAKGVTLSAPARLDVLAQLDAIRRGVTAWQHRLGLGSRGNLLADVRALVGGAANADDETRERLAGDVDRWRLSCLTLAGWRTSFRPNAPCPHCDQMPGAVDGKPVGLRVRLDKSTASCMTEDCGATWNQWTIGILAEHVRAYREEP